jgi:hypothetical protein
MLRSSGELLIAGRRQSLLIVPRYPPTAMLGHASDQRHLFSGLISNNNRVMPCFLTEMTAIQA